MTPASTGSPLLVALAPLVEHMRRHPEPRTPASEAQVAELIYRACHGREDVLGSAGPLRGGDEAPAREFVARLSNANCGNGPAHDHWTVSAVEDDGRLAVELDGLMLWVDPQPGAAPGERVRVRFPKEYRHLYPGHYVAIGDADTGEISHPLRLYWHIRADGAETLVRCVSEAFNRSKLPFRLKLLSEPAGYRRADAAILYLPSEHRGDGAALIKEAYLEMGPLMHPAVSAFVLPLAPGLGLAEDPPDRSSFGLHRSRLIAPLLYDALDHTDPLAGIAAALETAGYRLDRFYLNPGSAESYGEFLVNGD
jgi:hypothetical protein